MVRPEHDVSAYLEHRVLLMLLVTVSLGLGWVLLPFYGTILWGSIIALLFAPVHRRLLARLAGRRTPAALLTLLIAVVIVIVPFAIVSAMLAREAMLVYERVQSGQWSPALYFEHVFGALPPSMMALLDRFGLADFDTLQRRLSASLVQGSQWIAMHALRIGLGTFEFVADLFITAYIAFFLIRDGNNLVRVIRRAIPLADEDKKELVDKFATVIRATVKGDLLVMAIQGALGGFDRELREGLPGFRDPPFLDSRPARDPLIGGVDHFLEVLVGQDPGGNG